MEQTISIPVTFTASAIQEVRRLMGAEHFNQEQKLRVGVRGGGCSGMTYILEFDDKQEKDIEFTWEGIPCIMNPSHEMYLAGMEVDWQDGLNNRGFTFKNPNANTTCGCGTSFGI